MTAEFNITIPGAELFKRLADLETQVRDLANEQATDRVMIDTYADKVEDIENTYPTVGYVDGHLEVLSRHFDYRLREEVAVLKDLIAGNIKPNIPANDPKPPVDTSWHPYDVLVDGVVGDHPTGDKHIVVLTRYDNIEGPAKADTFDWGECGGGTIVAWRYAKEGE